MITPCSIRGTTIEAHINPIMEVNVLSWHLAYDLLGNVTLRPSDTLLKSCPSGHILECRGVASAVTLIIDKIEVNLDFHIFDNLNFDLFLGSLFEKLLVSQGSLDEMLRKTASATATSCLENPMAKQLPKPSLLKEMVHESPFISSEPVLFEMVGTAISEEYDSNEILHFCEDERSSSPLDEFEPLSFGLEYIVLDLDRDTNMILNDASLEMENRWAMEFYEATTLESEGKDSVDEHGSFILVITQEPCSFTASPESSTLCALSIHED